MSGLVIENLSVRVFLFYFVVRVMRDEMRGGDDVNSIYQPLDERKIEDFFLIF